MEKWVRRRFPLWVIYPGLDTTASKAQIPTLCLTFLDFSQTTPLLHFHPSVWQEPFNKSDFTSLPRITTQSCLFQSARIPQLLPFCVHWSHIHSSVFPPASSLLLKIYCTHTIYTYRSAHGHTHVVTSSRLPCGSRSKERLGEAAGRRVRLPGKGGGHVEELPAGRQHLCLCQQVCFSASSANTIYDYIVCITFVS